MNFSIPILDLEVPCETSGNTQKKTISYEYELIASMVLQQYQREGEVLFERLLMIPGSERIPALMVEYGAIRLYRVMLSMLINFSRFPSQEDNMGSKQEMNESVSALLSAANVNDLSLEDFVLFFERAKSGYYGAPKNIYNGEKVLKQFCQFLKEREKAIVEFAQQKTIELKALANGERLETEPIKIGDILNATPVVSMNKKMSG